MDFCVDILSPKITTDKPSVDGAEVTNLISTKNCMRKGGFVSEGFVRPPLDIKIEFPLAVDIARIECNTEVGSRKSRGISVFANFESDSNCNTSMSSFISSKIPSTSRNNSYNTVKTGDNDDIFICLGKWFIDKGSKVVVKNYTYQHLLRFPLPDVAVSSDCFVGALRHPSRCPLAPVKSLLVRILAVTPTGSPVMQSIHVWGQPSIMCDTILRRNMIKMWQHNFISPLLSKSENISPSSSNSSNSHSSYDNDKTEVQIASDDIPEEFLDPLTYDMMIVPILLPSGNTIDMHSLEKFIANESVWGRPASDPFTGVAFTESYRPEPNVSLKARIARFFLLGDKYCSSSVKPMGRTVGSPMDGLDVFSSLKRKSESEVSDDSETVKKMRLNEDTSHVLLSESDSQQGSSTAECVGNGQLLSKQPVLETLKEVTGSLDSELESRSYNQVCASKEKMQPYSKLNTMLAQSTQLNSHFLPPKVPHTSKIPVPSVQLDRHNLVHSLGNALSYSTRILSVQKKIGSLVTLKYSSNKSTGSTADQTQKLTGNADSSTDTNAKSSDIGSLSTLPRPPTVKTGDIVRQEETFSIQSIMQGTLQCQCGQREILYKLACEHYICRQCITLRPRLPYDTIQCNKCIKICRKCDIERVHQKSIFNR